MPPSENRSADRESAGGEAMSFERLALLGAQEIVRLIGDGRVPMRQAWVGVNGAARYRKLVAAGLVRSEAAARACWRECAVCPHRHETTGIIDVEGKPVVMTKHWCGPPLEPNGTTCGCLVGLTIGGGGVENAVPAGKTVGDERAGVEAGIIADARDVGCPMGRW